MSVIHRRLRQLDRIESGLNRSDPRLGEMLRDFGKLSAGEAMPAREQGSSGRHGIRRRRSSIAAGPAVGRAPRKPRTAFVLAGGASLGAMQAGMVRALYER